MYSYKTLLIILIIILFIVALLSYVKSVMLYYPMPANEDKYKRFYRKLLTLTESKDYIINSKVKTSDDILLDSIYIQNPDSEKCIIFFHGNAGNISMRFDMIKFLYNYCSIVIFDYRSYGKSSGHNVDLSESTLYLDAKAIWNYVTLTLQYKPSSISLFGESLGCAICIKLVYELSKTHNPFNYPHSLILNSPFYSLAAMINTIFSKINLLPIGQIISSVYGLEYQSKDLIKYLNHYTKILIAHSMRDEIVPFEQGKKLYEEISSVHSWVKFVTITGTHNNLGLTDNYIYHLAEIYNN